MKLGNRIVLGVGALAVLLQVVPYGRSHENPPVTKEPDWDRPETRALAVRACFDCHSNQTVWPWYAHVAPFSWLVQHDVDEARHELNFTEWDRPQHEAKEAAEMVREGYMPLSLYLWMHSDAELSETERDALAHGFAAMFGIEEEHAEAEHED